MKLSQADAPVIVALCVSLPLPPCTPVSTIFLALSNAPPMVFRNKAKMMPVRQLARLSCSLVIEHQGCLHETIRAMWAQSTKRQGDSTYSQQIRRSRRSLLRTNSAARRLHHALRLSAHEAAADHSCIPVLCCTPPQSSGNLQRG